jgi:hypothetical protein
MERSGIEQLLYMMDSAFDGERWHSVLTNLGSVKDENWDWTPPGGHRTIRLLVQELGGCKYAYDSHAFGNGSMHWENYPGSVPVPPEGFRSRKSSSGCEMRTPSFAATWLRCRTTPA